MSHAKKPGTRNFSYGAAGGVGGTSGSVSLSALSVSLSVQFPYPFPIPYQFIINFNFSTKAFLFHLDPLLVKCADSSVWNDTEVILELAGIKSCDFFACDNMSHAKKPDLNRVKIIG